MFARAVALTGTVAFAVAMLGMLVSNRFGDRLQQGLMWLAALLLRVMVTGLSVQSLLPDLGSWWWLGVVLGGGLVVVASLGVWQAAQPR
jgi:hypothetical protein